MTATAGATRSTGADVRPRAQGLIINVISAHDTGIVHVTGELDRASRNQLVSESTAGRQPTVLIDLGGVTFMDSSGYRALVASRRFIEGEGRSLTITGQTGQPARFLDMIAEFEKCPLGPSLNHRLAPAQQPSSSCGGDSAGVRVAIHSR